MNESTRILNASTRIARESPIESFLRIANEGARVRAEQDAYAIDLMHRTNAAQEEEITALRAQVAELQALLESARMMASRKAAL